MNKLDDYWRRLNTPCPTCGGLGSHRIWAMRRGDRWYLHDGTRVQVTPKSWEIITDKLYDGDNEWRLRTRGISEIARCANEIHNQWRHRVLPIPDGSFGASPPEGWPVLKIERKAELKERASKTKRRNRRRQGKDHR